ncbi:unnamed protein product [Haemonchus placei]|uniref:RRM domain-containing protein n=1 Tax=Haemonchus placei TaxID=6290 RepID=A0A0N4X149_HAEPC|nr:unnamed protein product [Haemonchus placei]
MSEAISIGAAAKAPKTSIKPEKKGKKPLYVVKLKHLPYGFFEKTGNFKGWAYVGFDNKDVAEIAAETMNGYLMFEKRLTCHVMAPDKIPKSMKSGPRYVAPPHMRGRAKKDALKRNKDKTKDQEEKTKRNLKKLKNLGIDYGLEAMSTSTSMAVSFQMFSLTPLFLISNFLVYEFVGLTLS